MYTVTKTMEIACAHNLDLPYASPCQRLHGHNLRISITLQSDILTEYGMVMDFKVLKSIMDKTIGNLDHKNLNEEVSFNPTAENLASYIACCMDAAIRTLIDNEHVSVLRVTVQESEGNVATWER